MIQIVLISFLCAVVIVYLRTVNSEFVSLAIVASGVILFSTVFKYLVEIYDFFNKITSLTGIDSQLFKIIFKITAVGYLVEFGAGIIEDFGLKGLSNKLVFCGKIIIFSISLPILYAVFNLLTEILQ